MYVDGVEWGGKRGILGYYVEIVVLIEEKYGRSFPEMHPLKCLDLKGFWN